MGDCVVTVRIHALVLFTHGSTGVFYSCSHKCHLRSIIGSDFRRVHDSCPSTYRAVDTSWLPGSLSCDDNGLGGLIGARPLVLSSSSVVLKVWSPQVDLF